MDAAATAPLVSALEQITEALRQHSSRLPEVRSSVASLMAAIDELNGNCTRTDLLTSRIMGLRSGMEKVRPQRGSRECPPWAESDEPVDTIQPPPSKNVMQTAATAAIAQALRRTPRAVP